MCHVYVRSDSLAAVLIADHEYPGKILFVPSGFDGID